MNTEADITHGSKDHLAPAERMAAVDSAMRRYFNSEDWLRARGKEFPGLKSV